MRIRHTPQPGWNDGTEDFAAPMTSVIDAADVQRQIAETTREVNETVGMSGSLSRVSSGGVQMQTGSGLEAISGGIRRTQVEPDGDFFAGSDIDDPAGVSIAVFVNTQEYNGESMEEGDLLIGDNSTGSSNVKWDASEGRLQFRAGTTVQVYMDTDGSLKAGGGAVTLDIDGISIITVSEGDTTNDLSGSYKFVDENGTLHSRINNFADEGLNHLAVETVSVSGKISRTVIGANAHADKGASARLFASLQTVDTAYMEVYQDPDGTSYAELSALETYVGDVIVVDGGAEHRLEIGADHYFPTRASSNPNGFWNEANQDMDFTFEGTTGDIVKMDAGLNALIVSKIANGDGLAHGTYTPTLTNTTNIAASAVSGPFSYIRVGNVVHVEGAVTIDPTAATTTTLHMSLPIASNFSSAFEGSGGGSSQASNTAGNIASDATTDSVSLSFQATDTANRAWRVWFSYQVI